MAAYQRRPLHCRDEEEPEAQCSTHCLRAELLGPAARLPQLQGEERATLPEVDGPDVLLDACCRVQHLATVFPKAFEHHLHGVLWKEEETTSQCMQTCPESPSCPPDHFPFFRNLTACHVLDDRILRSGQKLRLLPFLHGNRALLLILTTFP